MSTSHVLALASCYDLCGKRSAGSWQSSPYKSGHGDLWHLRGKTTMCNGGTVALNNYLQTISQVNMLSWEESTAGPRHAPTWTCVCKIGGQEFGRGTGAQKHIARDMAADAALRRLTESSHDADI